MLGKGKPIYLGQDNSNNVDVYMPFHEHPEGHITYKIEYNKVNIFD